ncbi:rod shape-determining protein MreC [Erythrobacter crassostreae]|uniref:Rod shape-determining protein MreC n=1 Tax=Erythrobacter crassostreae TaxID=2828328 RepID=A0A9X1F471_9SPHN|nr:rod shape-determining protein MreC [Erythrobacter crassostrea]MBV7259935.1 rod shape-determining protein MreC [Erythrobacter crassostrea]
MAPPSSRRSSGFSKRAQYSVFTGYLLAGLGALLGLGLLALSLWQPSAFAPLRGGAQDVVTTVGEGPAVARNAGGSTWDSIKGYFNAGSQNAALREEVELARIKLAEAEAVAQENERLKSLVALAESEIEPVAVTRLVGSSATSSRRFAYIGKGRLQGIEVGMPVRSPRGVVGRVLEVARSSSRILLLTDSESVLPVRRSSDDTVAFAEGRGDGMVRIRLINLGLNPLEIGDVFVTSGAGGYYRPGVAVAVLTELSPDGGLARLVAAPSATDFVSVEPIYVPEAVNASEIGPQDSIVAAENED